MNKSQRSCLLLHGFSGGPFEVEPLAIYLEQRGWTCRVPTLPGHGDEKELLKSVRYQDWLEAAEKEAELMVKQN